MTSCAGTWRDTGQHGAMCWAVLRWLPQYEQRSCNTIRTLLLRRNSGNLRRHQRPACLYYTILYYTMLHYTLLYYTMLYYTWRTVHGIFLLALSSKARSPRPPARSTTFVGVALGTRLCFWSWEERFYTPPPPGNEFRDCDCARIETKASIHHPLGVVLRVVVVVVYRFSLLRSTSVPRGLSLGSFHLQAGHGEDARSGTASLRTETLQTGIRRLKLSRNFPMGLEVPPLTTKILLRSSLQTLRNPES